MKFLAALPLAAVIAAASSLAAHADDGMSPAKLKAFDVKVFGAPVGGKASACFVRR